GKAGLLHGTSSGKGTRKFHFWRLLIGRGDYRETIANTARLAGASVTTVKRVWAAHCAQGHGK
ncbi:hypothetical protein KWH44_20860, partial [Xanthomonas campestris pv. veroniae]|nr:hypothetical protein [Xanthomonas campestris pv. veroniae]